MVVRSTRCWVPRRWSLALASASLMGPACHAPVRCPGGRVAGGPTSVGRTMDPTTTGLDAESDVELATRLATQAGHGLVAVRQRLEAEGAHTWQVMDGGDTASQRFLADELTRLRPRDAVLSEE